MIHCILIIMQVKALFLKQNIPDTQIYTGIVLQVKAFL